MRVRSVRPDVVVLAVTFGLLLLSVSAPRAGAYPLDQAEETGIWRLEAFWRARESLLASGRLQPGALWPAERVRLRLADRPAFAVPAADPALSASLRELLGEEAPRYAVALLDLSDPSAPRYADHNPNRIQNPASVGKVMVALAFLQVLADVHPDDLEARRRVLRDTIVTANEFILKDEHTVSFWKPGDRTVRSRPIVIGDQASLSTFLDWMLTNSSSAAASQLQEQMLLLLRFGAAYPVSAEVAKAYLEDTPKAELGRIFVEAMRASIERNGLSWSRVRQGSFFTRTGKRCVPGTNSVATARELMMLLARMEQGKLVDRWSSLELKRLLYNSDRRIRYASSPALRDAAVYFKSGSFYGCKQEPGFTCGEYMGNRMNYMNSVIVVEEERDGRSLHYIVALLSNVLRKNSAVAHQTLGTRIHRMLQRDHPPVAVEVMP